MLGSLRIRSESSKRAEEQGGRARRRRGVACVLAHSELCQATKLGHSAEFQARGSAFTLGRLPAFQDNIARVMLNRAKKSALLKQAEDDMNEDDGPKDRPFVGAVKEFITEFGKIAKEANVGHAIGLVDSKDWVIADLKSKIAELEKTKPVTSEPTNASN